MTLGILLPSQLTARQRSTQLAAITKHRHGLDASSHSDTHSDKHVADKIARERCCFTSTRERVSGDAGRELLRSKGASGELQSYCDWSARTLHVTSGARRYACSRYGRANQDPSSKRGLPGIATSLQTRQAFTVQCHRPRSHAALYS